MFFSSSKKSDAKQELLEKARRERELRAAAQQGLPLALHLQAHYRGWRTREATVSLQLTELTLKLQQIAMLTAALKSSKGIDFVPPSSALSVLVSQACLILRASGAIGRCASALGQLVAWLQLHFRRAEGSSSLAATPIGVGQITRLLIALLRRMPFQLATIQVETQLQFIDFALFCVGSASSERLELRSAGAAWLQALALRSSFNDTVCRPLCMPAAAPDAERAFSPGELQRRLCAKTVELALILSDAAAATAAVRSKAKGSARGEPPLRAHPHVLVLTQLLSIPYITVSISGSPAHALLLDPRNLHLMITGYDANPQFVDDPPLGFSTGGSKRGKSKHSPPSTGHIRSGGGAASSSAVNSADTPENGPMEWPGGAFLLGNVVQLLTDAPPTAAGAPSVVHGTAASALESLDPR